MNATFAELGDMEEVIYFRDINGELLSFKDHPLFTDYYKTNYFKPITDEMNPLMQTFLIKEEKLEFWEVKHSAGKLDFDQIFAICMRDARTSLQKLIALEFESLKQNISRLSHSKEPYAELELYKLLNRKRAIEHCMALNSVQSFVSLLIDDMAVPVTSILALLEDFRLSPTIETVLLDSLLFALKSQDQSKVMFNFHIMVAWRGLINQIFHLEYGAENSVVKNHMKSRIAQKSQKKGQERFKEAKSFARLWAKKTWDEEPLERYGVVAKNIYNAIDQAPEELNLTKAPSLKAIKSWIKDLAPSEECLKGGRPKT